MPTRNRASFLREAQSALSRGDYRHAASVCGELLAHDARDPDARYFLGLAHALRGDTPAAIEEWERVLRIEPRHFSTLVNLGAALGRQGRFSEANVRLRAALAIDASRAQLHYNLGNSLLATNDVDGAAASFREAVARDPRFADAWNNLGVAHRRAGRLDEARAAFAAAVAANPGLVGAHSNLGAALLAAGENEAAAASLAKAVALDSHGTEPALNLYRALEQLGRPDEALAVLAAAAIKNPDSFDIHYVLGVARQRAGQPGEAVLFFERAVALRPEQSPAWRDRGLALESAGRRGEALDSFRRALALAPDDTGALAGIVGSSVRTCDWEQMEPALQRLRALPSGHEALHPFLAQRLGDDPEEQLRLSVAHGRGWAALKAIAPAPRRAPHRRIRIAYVSSDLREHPVGYALAGVLERHDRDRFEVHGVALRNEASESRIGQRLRQALEHRHEAASLSDSAATRLLQELEIDIAIDLNGYTIGGRPGIFARRAALVQVNFLGYPGTLGVPYCDYLLADSVVIPDGEDVSYRERVVRLPHCYLPFDDRREIDVPPRREAAGLPEEGLIFCAFTNPYKISEPVFAIWMRLLRETESVLWLRESQPEVRVNLEREAHRHGIPAERLVFAPPMPAMAAHLARQSLADLYLDTVPYSAHSTACDALWSGLPVLTCAGRTFASRVAASALTAVGLPELITVSLAEYESRALELARDRRQLQALRARLAAKRSAAPLFDTARYTRHLECAFETMHRRAESGGPPTGFSIPA